MSDSVRAFVRDVAKRLDLIADATEREIANRDKCIEELQADLAATAKQRDAQTMRADRMRRAGGMLANCAFNLAQRDEIDEPTRRALKERQKEWDAALLPPPAEEPAPSGAPMSGEEREALVAEASKAAREWAQRTYDPTRHRIPGLPIQRAERQAWDRMHTGEPAYREGYLAAARRYLALTAPGAADTPDIRQQALAWALAHEPHADVAPLVADGWVAGHEAALAGKASDRPAEGPGVEVT